MPELRSGLWTLAVALAVACSSSSSSSNKTDPCSPGESVPCTSSTGCSGQKLCKASGDGFSECACSDAGAEAGNAGEPGSTGGGGGGSSGAGGMSGGAPCGEASDCGADSVCASWDCPDGTCVRVPEADGVSCGDCQECSAGDCVDVPGGMDSNEDCGGDEACNGSGACQCADMSMNFGETDIDCGGPCAQCSAGRTCNAPADCVTGNCVDDVCCSGECTAPCSACVQALTGVDDGACAPITEGLDPGGECSPGSCNGIGACHCGDGIRSGNETGIDCGGDCAACAGTWNCTGTPACGDGAGQTVCTANACANEAATCLALHGTGCTSAGLMVQLQTGAQDTSGCVAGQHHCLRHTCTCNPG